MQIVYIPGVWDLLHVGHLTILERAKALGDRLVVGVPSDGVVKEDKGTTPVIRLEDRLRMLAALRCVDVAIPYYRLEFLAHLRMIQPDILAVGEAWGHDRRHAEAEQWIMQHRRRVVRLPYYEGESCTDIRERVCRDGRDPPAPEPDTEKRFG